MIKITLQILGNGFVPEGEFVIWMAYSGLSVSLVTFILHQLDETEDMRKIDRPIAINRKSIFESYLHSRGTSQTKMACSLVTYTSVWSARDIHCLYRSIGLIMSNSSMYLDCPLGSFGWDDLCVIPCQEPSILHQSLISTPNHGALSAFKPAIEHGGWQWNEGPSYRLKDSFPPLNSVAACWLVAFALFPSPWLIKSSWPWRAKIFLIKCFVHY